MKTRIILLLIIAMNMCSCSTRMFSHIDELPYLMQMDIFVNGEERSYELLHPKNGYEHYYSSEVSIEKVVNSRAMFRFAFRAKDIKWEQSTRGYNDEDDFSFHFFYIVDSLCFIEGQQYYLRKEDNSVYPRELEQGWFSLYLSDEPGIAFLIIFDISYSPSEYTDDIFSVSGTIKIAKDFIGYEKVSYVYDGWGKLIEISAPHWKGDGLIKKE